MDSPRTAASPKLLSKEDILLKESREIEALPRTLAELTEKQAETATMIGNFNVEDDMAKVLKGFSGRIDTYTLPEFNRLFEAKGQFVYAKAQSPVGGVDTSCPECGGRGKIDLLVSTVPCKKCQPAVR